jgi:hypothetical protein
MAFRVLSLDGGGVWSVVQALALIRIYDEKTTGHQVLQDFDLVAATSAGSIVLGGLVENLPLAAILQIFENENSRKEMFSASRDQFSRFVHWATGKFPGLGGSGVGPIYSTEKKRAALEKLLGPLAKVPLTRAANGVRRSGSARDVHLLIIAFDYDRERAQFFRSAQAGGRGWGAGDASSVTLAEAINASTDPPINYFDKPARIVADRYWDGAIAGYNNPVLAAVSEARVLSQAPTDIVALSIGTGRVTLAGPPTSKPSPFVVQRKQQCLVSDIGKIAVSIVDDPPDAATFVAHVMTGGIDELPYPLESRIVRMSPLVRPELRDGEWAAPGGMTTAEFTTLAGLGIDAIEQAQVDAIARYAQMWIANSAPNQPIRMNGDTFECELGHETFGDALAAWRQLTALSDGQGPLRPSPGRRRPKPPVRQSAPALPPQ